MCECDSDFHFCVAFCFSQSNFRIKKYQNDEAYAEHEENQKAKGREPRPMEEWTEGQVGKEWKGQVKTYKQTACTMVKKGLLCIAKKKNIAPASGNKNNVLFLYLLTSLQIKTSFANLSC